MDEYDNYDEIFGAFDLTGTNRAPFINPKTESVHPDFTSAFGWICKAVNGKNGKEACRVLLHLIYVWGGIEGLKLILKSINSGSIRWPAK